MMEDTKRKIEVMQACVEGKKIQIKGHCASKWIDCAGPSWNWVTYDYRVKPEEKYRPYKDYQPYKDYHEMVEDFCERFGVNCPAYAMPLIWVKEKDSKTVRLIKSFPKETEFGSVKRWFLTCTYLDGSPVGKKEEK